MSDLIDRQQAIDALNRITRTDNWQAAVSMALMDLPSAQPETHFDEWCTDCKEYDHEKHCCPRFNKVIRRTVEELKPQPKTGKWIKNYSVIRCSECKRSSWSLSFEDLVRNFNYCPNCGAKMKEGDLND